MRYRRTGESVNEYIVEFDLLCRKAEPKVVMGAGFPEQFIPISCMGNAALFRHGKSLVIASCRKSLRFEDASAKTPRLFGSRGGGSRQDALITEEAVEPHASDGDLDV